MIDEKGRCCGRKPIIYKSGSWTPLRKPHLFCDRCGKDYEIAYPHKEIEKKAI